MAIDNFNPFDTAYNQPRKNRGWIRQDKITNPVELSAESRIYKEGFSDSVDVEEQLVLHCLEEIKHNIYKSGALDVRFEAQSYDPNEIRCRVSLKLMPVDITKCVVHSNVFRVHGVEFTEAEVEEAILKAFPYKLV